MSEVPFFTFRGVKIDNFSFMEVQARIAEAVEEGGYVCLTEVGTLIAATNDEDLRTSINKSLISIPDGTPLAWFGRLSGSRKIERVSGPDLFARFLLDKNYRHFLLGDTDDTISRIIEKAQRITPGLEISGYCPPFKDVFNDADNREMLAKIREAEADIIWVSFGGLKQNKWMNRHIQELDRGVMIGVGAAFRFYTGDLRTAPRILQKLGLQWFYRMLSSPRRWFKYQFFKRIKFVFCFPFELAASRRAVKKFPR